MIEQYTIATTPKYNFPQTNMDTTLPRRLIELSIHSLKNVRNQPIQLNQQKIQQATITETENSILQLKPEPIFLKPNYEAITIAAVDTSSMKIGETETGILTAIRGATVWKQNKHYHYMRLGPFILHVTEENKNEVYQMLQMAYFNNNSNSQIHQSFFNLAQTPTRIATFLERWLQTMLSKTLSKSLILFDGSLTAGTADTSTQQMKEILSTARKRQNIILAFSKMTNLRVNGHLITEISLMHQPPYLLETQGFKPKPPITLFGDVYVARLSFGNYAFRLDIDKEVSADQRIEAVEKLLGNELLLQSYPETLRLAHILCTFTANEVIAMQHFISSKCGLRMINRPDMHRLLFGPFGKGDGNS